MSVEPTIPPLDDRVAGDAVYHRRVCLVVSTLDDGQVDVLRGRLPDHWRSAAPLSDDLPLPEETAPGSLREQLILKLRLDGLMYGAERARADLDALLEECFGVGPGPASGGVSPQQAARL